MKSKFLRATLLGSGLVVLPIACGGDEPTAQQNPTTAEISLQAKPGDSESVKQAKQKFAGLCQTCHGMSGRGDGPAGANLNPKPRSFGDPAWQESVTDDHIRAIIVGGGPAVGMSVSMPPNPDLQAKPEVVDALTEIVRSFKQ